MDKGMNNVDDRLQRIEEKLDKIADLALNHAVLEQKVTSVYADLNRIITELVELKQKVIDLEKENRRLLDRLNLIYKLLGVALVILLGMFGITI